MPPLKRLEDYIALLDGDRRHGAAPCALPVVIEGYTPPRDPRVARAQRHARSGRDRSQRPSGVVVARTDRDDPDAVRGSAPDAPRHRKIHARRPPHRHRRRQPHHAGRRHAGRQPAAAATRSAAEPRHLLAEPSRRCRICFPACSSVRPARRRASTRRATTGSTSSRSRFSSSSASTSSGKTNRSPWLVDRLLRHLLTDLTGNTHRAEFSIDKLYSPDTRDRASGPARVSRLRDAAARANERGADAAAARAGRALLAAALSRRLDSLGHGAARSLAAAALRRCRHARCRPRTQRSSAIAFDASWFDPFVEFRFPRFGVVDLRRRDDRAASGDRALARAGRGNQRTGTARYVDSSVERLQVQGESA